MVKDILKSKFPVNFCNFSQNVADSGNGMSFLLLWSILGKLSIFCGYKFIMQKGMSFSCMQITYVPWNQLFCLMLCLTTLLHQGPYSVPTNLHQTAKTKVIKSCLNPVWNEEFSFSLSEPIGALKLVCYLILPFFSPIGALELVLSFTSPLVS